MAMIGFEQMPSLFTGTNEAISRLAETIREGLQDHELVRMFWIFRDAVPKDDLSIILSIHERRIIQEVWESDI